MVFSVVSYFLRISGVCSVLHLLSLQDLLSVLSKYPRRKWAQEPGDEISCFHPISHRSGWHTVLCALLFFKSRARAEAGYNIWLIWNFDHVQKDPCALSFIQKCMLPTENCQEKIQRQLWFWALTFLQHDSAGIYHLLTNQIRAWILKHILRHIQQRSCLSSLNSRNYFITDIIHLIQMYNKIHPLSSP